MTAGARIAAGQEEGRAILSGRTCPPALPARTARTDRVVKEEAARPQPNRARHPACQGRSPMAAADSGAPWKGQDRDAFPDVCFAASIHSEVGFHPKGTRVLFFSCLPACLPWSPVGSDGLPSLSVLHARFFRCFSRPLPRTEVPLPTAHVGFLPSGRFKFGAPNPDRRWVASRCAEPEAPSSSKPDMCRSCRTDPQTPLRPAQQGKIAAPSDDDLTTTSRPAPRRLGRATHCPDGSPPRPSDQHAMLASLFCRCRIGLGVTRDRSRWA
jgi:hypothetical protein